MKKKHSLIIGGTRGIGRELVKMLAEEGGIVSVIGKREPAEGDKNVPNTAYWAIDIADKTGLSRALDDIVRRNGKINNLVFLQRYKGKEDAWAGEMETTLTVTKEIIEALSDKFADNGDASIVMASSIFGRFIADGQPLGYHVAKAGLEQMVRYFAVTLGPKGIRVNGVSPFTVLKEESKDFYLRNKELHDLYRKIVPLKRMGTSEDVANVIAFLCGEKASYINGQIITIDGGLSLKWQESLARGLTDDGKRIK